MKRISTFTFLLFTVVVVRAQVQVDKRIDLTGAGNNAKVTGIKDVSAAQDATSAEVVQKGGLNYAPATGSANAIEVTLSPSPAAYQAGMIVNFKASAINTSAVTINVNGLGNVTIKKNVTDDLAAGDIKAGQLINIMHDGTNFQTLSSSSGNTPDCITLSTKVSPPGYSYTGYGSSTYMSTNLFWTSKADLPIDKQAPGVCAYNNKLYVMGGTSGSGSIYVPKCYSYDPTGNTWTALANMPVPRFQCSAVVVNSKIYVIGGQNGGACDEAYIQEYDPAGNSWATKMATGTGLKLAAMAVYNNKVYIFGGSGYCSNSPMNSVCVYDPASNTLTSISNMPISRLGASAVTVGSKIYIFGGVNGSTNQNTARVDEFDPASGTYVQKADMPTARANFAAVILNNTIYCIGGGNNNEAYNPATNNWTFKTQMPTNRSYVGGDAINGSIYIVAGGVGSYGEVANERYTPSSDPGAMFYMHCKN